MQINHNQTLYFVFCLFNEKLKTLENKGFIVNEINGYAIITQNVHSSVRNNFSHLKDFFKDLNVKEWIIILTHKEMQSYDRFIYLFISTININQKYLKKLI